MYSVMAIIQQHSAASQLNYGRSMLLLARLHTFNCLLLTSVSLRTPEQDELQHYQLPSGRVCICHQHHVFLSIFLLLLLLLLRLLQQCSTAQVITQL
jgi:hypothetical protein